MIALAVLGGAVVLWPRGELARPPGAGQADSTRVVSATLTKVARLDCEEADPGVPGSICIKVSARLAGGRQVTFDTLPCRQALSRRPEPVSEINVPQPPLSEGCETVSCMGHLLGYARVSTTDQQPQLQVDALQGAGCYRVFVETASGARSDRPILTQILDQLRPGDTLVVWKLDRLGRSLRHLVDTVTGLAERGIGFRSLQEAIDTTTPGGKLVFHVFAALAEFERDLIRERTTAGLAAARARGRHGGRPSVMTTHKVRVAQEMYASGQYTVAAIATTLGVSRASIYRHLSGVDS